MSTDTYQSTLETASTLSAKVMYFTELSKSDAFIDFSPARPKRKSCIILPCGLFPFGSAHREWCKTPFPGTPLLFFLSNRNSSPFSQILFRFQIVFYIMREVHLVYNSLRTPKEVVMFHRNLLCKLPEAYSKVNSYPYCFEKIAHLLPILLHL